jgi:hypothetical protein
MAVNDKAFQENHPKVTMAQSLKENKKVLQ